jgi:hypothetical protein
MLTTHIFHRGNRCCVHCGLPEDAVEFKPGCPSPNAWPAHVPVEKDFMGVIQMDFPAPTPLGGYNTAETVGQS